MADVFGSGSRLDKWTIKATEWINYLYNNRQALLTPGTNITLTPLQDGTVQIDAVGGGGGGNVDDVNVNGVSVVDANKVAQITSYKELKQSEYDALPSSKLTDGVLYCINDTGIVEGQQFAPEIYSLVEREIGTWTDGRPLYKKTYVFTISDLADATIDATQFVGKFWIDNIDYGDLWMDDYFLVNYTDPSEYSGLVVFSHNLLYNNASSGSITATRVNIQKRRTISNGAPYIYFNNTYDMSDLYPQKDNLRFIFNVKYTKSTDIPGSGSYGTDGIPMHHYSETEHIIGTWIDGSTLYEKTMEYQIQTTLTDGLTDIFYLPNISLVKVNAFLANTKGRMYPLPYADGSAYDSLVYNKNNNDYLSIKILNDSWTSIYKLVATVQYIKATS